MAKREARRFWQIHLSTALMSTLVAGVFLGLNLVERDVSGEYQKWYVSGYSTLAEWGWPCRLGHNFVPKSTVPETNGAHYDWYSDAKSSGAINLGICALLTLSFMAACEHFIRREKLRRAARLEYSLKQ